MQREKQILGRAQDDKFSCGGIMGDFSHFAPHIFHFTGVAEISNSNNIRKRRSTCN